MIAVRPEDHRRVALVHGTILCLSLMAATFAYTRPQWATRDATATVVPKAPRGPLAITYAEGATSVMVERNAEGSVTIEVTTTSPEHTLARYHGNAAAEHLLDTLLPIEARRPLGMLDAAHRTSFGLEPAQATVVVATQSQRTVVALGHALYGSGDVYALVEGRGGYVLPAGISRPFHQQGFALWDRRFLRAQLADIKRFEASVDGRRCTFMRVLHSDDAQGFARTQTPELRDAPAEALIQAWVQLEWMQAAAPPEQVPASKLSINWVASAQGSASIVAQGERAVGLSDAQFEPVTLAASHVESLWSLTRDACPQDARAP